MKQLVNYGYGRERFEIKVTKTDIKNGKKSDPYECPVGLALARALKKKFNGNSYTSSHYTIWGNAITFSGDYRGYFDTALPAKALKFLEAFDAGLPVKPFQFNVSVTNYFYCEHT